MSGELSVTQLSLALARRTDPETSHAAAALVDASTLSGRVLAELRQNGPATIHSMAERLGISLVTASPRFAPLRRAGLIRAAWREGNRTVWEAVKA